MKESDRDRPDRGGTTVGRGQSTVIGAILLIVVTIILVSFVAVYVFDVGGQLGNSAPQSSITFQNTSGGLVATLDGGQNLPASNVEIVVRDDGTQPYAYAETQSASPGNTTRANADDSSIFGTGTIRVGDSATVAQSVGDGDEVRIVYIDPDSNQGTTLARYTG